jgi:UDP-glucose 4-epimerase
MSLYLVTGGAGFIGSHLCDALAARGDEIRVLDNLSTGRRANLSAGADLRVGDVADPDTAFGVTEGVAGCFHLAAIASVERGVSDWLGVHRTNQTGTIAIFDAIRRHGRKVPVVYASSAAVYGDCPTIPIPEAARCRPLSAYGADKAGCELHAMTASHVHGIPAVGLRFFNVYGPSQDPASPYSGVISVFCERISHGAQVEIFGDGRQTRDFIHVSDVVAGLLSAMCLASATAQVFNVCTGVATSVVDLAATIGDLTGNKPDLRHMDARRGEVRHSQGDPSNMRRILELDRMVGLRDGLGTVLAHLDMARLVPPY